MDIDAVSGAIKYAAAQEIVPRFRSLQAGEIEEKSPGEMVTVADRACELLLTDLLRDIADVPVVGEEAAATDETLESVIETSPAVWLVDPLDGTSNFAAGSTDYAVMVAFVERGIATASWMWHPPGETMAVGVRGAGAFLNGETVTARRPRPSPSTWRGVVMERFLPNDVKASVRANAKLFAGFREGRKCAGLDYPDLVSGAIDFLVYWRTLPWDHAPGVLFAEEAGCLGLRPNGDPFRCDSERAGLIVGNASMCDEFRRTLMRSP